MPARTSGKSIYLSAVIAAAASACADYKILPHDGGSGTGGSTNVPVGTGGGGGAGATGAGSGGRDAGLPDLAVVDGGGDGADAPAVMGAMLGLSPDTQSFGVVVLGRASASQTFSVVYGGQRTTGPAMVVLGGADRTEFQLTADGCSGQSLPQSSVCFIAVRYVPTSVGAKAASLTVSAAGAGSAVAQLSGTGITQGTLAITPDMRDFGPVLQATAGASQVFTIKNTGQATTGLLTTTFSGADSSNFSITTNSCAGHTLAEAATCTVSVQFVPVTPGAKLVTLSIAGAAGEMGVAQLSGMSLAGASIAITPAAKDFNSVTVNQSAMATFLVTNPGGGPTGLPVVAITGGLPSDSGQFVIPVGSNGCGAVIPAGGSCSIGVRFSPTTTGVKNGTLTVSANPGTSAAVALTGTGIAAGRLGISPLSQDFGSLLQGTVGATAVTFSVINSGASPTGTLQARVVGSTEFQINQDRCSQMVLAPQASCTVAVTFAPTTANPSGSLQIVATNPADSASAGLTGIGLAPAKLTITPTTSAFADTVVGQTGATPISFTVRNTGGVPAGTGAGLTPVIAGVNQADFGVVTGMSTCAASLAPGAQCTVVVAFSPKTVGSNKAASLSVNATPGGPAVASLGGNGITAAALTLAPAANNAAAFGSVVVGVPRDQTFVVSNTGQQASTGLQITFANAAGAGFSLLTGAADDCAANVAVPGNGRCNLRVRFAPAGRGAQTATLAVSAAVGGAPAGLTLTGTGQLPVGLTANPAAVALGSVTVGVNTPTSVMIINGGDLATGVPTVTNSNAAELTITGGCTAAIAASGSCTLALTFKAGAGGARSATVTVTVTGASVMFTVSATGVVPCGAVGQPCCTGAGVAACGQNLTCATATSTCACGGAGQPCCGGAGGTCSASGTVCGTAATCGAPTGNGIACQTSPQCASNNCTGSICCATGQSGCTGSCVNLTTDNANCGACGRTCVLGKETCVASTCRSNEGQPCSIATQCAAGSCAICFPDRDADGFGDKWAAATGVCGASCPVGSVLDHRDCLDDPSIFPRADAVNPNGTFHLGFNVPFPFAQYTPDPRDTSPDPWDYDCDDIRTLQTVSAGDCGGGATCANACVSGSGTLFDGSTCGQFLSTFSCTDACSTSGICSSVSTGGRPQGCR